MAKEKNGNKKKIDSKAKASINYQNQGAISNSGNNYGWQVGRTTRKWKNDLASYRVPTLTGMPRYQIIQHARALAKNNPFAKMLIQKAADNIVGENGFVLSVKSKSKQQWAKDVERKFKAWTENADIRGRSWIDHQKVVCKNLMTEGDLAVVFCKEYEHGSLQVIGASSIVTPAEVGSKSIIDGIEVDDVLRPLAVHCTVGDINGIATKRNSIEYTAFIANLFTDDDLRGMPCFDGYWKLFDQIDAYTQSSVETARLQSMLFGQKIVDPNKASSFGAYEKDEQGGSIEQIDTATMYHNRPGERLEFFKTESADIDLDKFITAILKIISPCVGIPIEVLFTSMGNYSSSQAAIQDAFKAFKGWQAILVNSYYRKMFRWWLDRAIDEGYIEDAPEDFRFEWITPSFIFVNRVESAQADLLEMTMGISSETEVLARRGKDWDEVMEQIMQEKAYRESNGLPELPKSTFVQAVAPQPQQDIEALAQAVIDWQAKSKGAVA